MLNPEQSAAVQHAEGPALVIACAGSGKTRVLTERVVHLIEQGTPAKRILLLTFTRRAAREMLERASEMHEDAKKVVGGTFHAFAMRMISTYYEHLGFHQPPNVIDPDDAANAVANVAERLNIDMKRKTMPSKKVLRNLFSLATNKRLTLEEAAEEMLRPHAMKHLEEIRAIRSAFTDYKHEQQYVDFDDLLVHLATLLKTPATRDRIAKRFDHVLVDEYQDTNPVQAEITLSLAKPHGNLMVVGDDAQSIYAFRGAYVDHILDFPERLPGCAHHTLESNYRSTQPILDTANAVLDTMSEAYGKHMQAATTSEGDPPRLNVFDDTHDEADWVAQQIADRVHAGEDPNEIVVLSRSSFATFPIQIGLSKLGIPYLVRGGKSLKDAAHVKDILASLRIIANPLDELAWMRGLQLLDRVGARTATRTFHTFFPTPENPMSVSLETARSIHERQPQRASSPMIGAYLDVLIDAHRLETPLERYDRVLEHYEPLLMERYEEDAASRLDDLVFLRTVVERYESLNSLLADLMLDPVTDQRDVDQDLDPVIISTVHSAKGLEWDTVYLLANGDGQLPGGNAIKKLDEEGDDRDVEEEKRLLYVAITRARRSLDLTYATDILSKKSSRPQLLSRFLQPDEVLATLDLVSHTDRFSGDPTELQSPLVVF